MVVSVVSVHPEAGSPEAQRQTTHTCKEIHDERATTKPWAPGKRMLVDNGCRCIHD
jgi:hypothetical protein